MFDEKAFITEIWHAVGKRDNIFWLRQGRMNKRRLSHDSETQERERDWLYILQCDAFAVYKAFV